jgi:hypothetical protein
MEEKKGCLLVRDLTSEVFDSIPAILEYTRTISTFNVGDRSLAGNHSLQTRMILFRPFLAHWKAPLTRTWFC